MNIYEATHLGQAITTQAAQDSLRQENQFQGFLSRFILEDLLNQPNCVGLRFYNAGGLAAGQRQMIAVGVIADGGELNLESGKRYFISNTTIGGPELLQTKSQASIAVNTTQSSRTGAGKERFNFSSFFSKTAIAQLLVPTAAGIRFYIVDLNANFLTHLAVSSDGPNPIAGQAGALPQHILSNNPCPGPTGGCAVLESVPGGATPPVMDTTKYLVIW